MKRHLARPRALLGASALCFALAPQLGAQATQPPKAAGTTEDDEAVVLSPFVINSTEDTNGYRANSTLAGSRVRTDLKDVASAISVVTQQFMQDTGARNNETLLTYTPSTEVAGLRGNFTGVAGTGVYQENTASATTRVRGLDSADNTRDYFLTDIPWDGFNVGRVDLQRGPNSILFGVGSPAGIINTSVNDASFKTAYHVENRVDEWGSLRNSVDLNQVLVKNVLAIRLAGLKDDRKYQQKPAFNNDSRIYGALRFDPKLFSEDNHTSLRVKYEKGKVRANNPRALPPVDEITPWFKTGKDQYGNYNYNKLTLNQFSLTNPNPTGTPMPGGTGGALATGAFEVGGWAQSRTYWAEVINYYEGIAAAKNNVSNANPASGTPIKTIPGMVNRNKGIPDSNGNHISGYPQYRPVGIPPMSQWAANVGPVTNGGFTWPGVAIPGGVYYADVVLTDPTIFDFYHNLLDGPNKRENKDWEALNVALEQSFLDNRLAFQVAFDHQKYSEMNNRFMTGANYGISIDVNETYADGSPNPNVGRPYVANGAGAPGINSGFDNTRNSVRFTATGELRSEDFLGKSKLSQILGKHVFTGLWESSKKVQDYREWARYATTPEYSLENGDLPTGLNSGREYSWLVYVGPNMKSKASASGANLSRIGFELAPPQRQQITNFNSTWNKPTNPNDPNYVDPKAPYTFTDNRTGAVTTSEQSQNPANYVGWSNQNITWLNSDNPNDFPDLVMSANRTRYRDISKGLTWQGYMLDGDLVPTFGWRKDSVTNYQTNAYTNPATGFTSLDYPDNDASRTDVKGESKSWGAVYHFPKSLMSRVPWGTTFSVFFDRSENFKADASRLSLSGLPIPNAKGTTREFGFQVTTLNDKLSLKVNWFKTRVNNASLGETAGNSIAGLGNNAYFIADGSIWGYAWATALQDGLLGRTPNNSYWDYAAGSGMPHGTPAEIAAYNAFNQSQMAIVNAWLKDAPFPKTFFSSYSLTPPLDPTIGSKTGNLRDSYPQGFDDSTSVPTGGGSNFGNHQTTVDNESRGVEIELTAQPVKNWNLTVNYSHVSAKHISIDQAAQDFIGKMTKFMNGPGGQVREWYNGGSTLGSQWNSSIVAPFTVQLNELGHPAPEVSPWRLNLITTYNFDRGAIKGLFVGGAVRIEAGRILGYKYDPKFKNVNSDDPNYAAVPGLTLGGLNVNQPLKGKNDEHLDLWFGYTRKITQKINWRIQVNLYNVGDKNKLVPARYQPDGSLALARIQEGMSWELTNAFDF